MRRHLGTIKSFGPDFTCPAIHARPFSSKPLQTKANKTRSATAAPNPHATLLSAPSTRRRVFCCAPPRSLKIYLRPVMHQMQPNVTSNRRNAIRSTFPRQSCVTPPPKPANHNK